MFTCKNKMKAFFIFLVTSNTIPMHGMFRSMQYAPKLTKYKSIPTQKNDYLRKSLWLSGKYSAMSSMNRSASTIQNRYFSNIHSNDHRKNNSWDSKIFNRRAIGGASLMSSSANADTAVISPDQLRQLTDEQKIAILDERNRDTKIYYSGEKGELNPKQENILFKSIGEGNFEKLDPEVKEEYCKYLEELGFPNPKQYILFYKVPDHRNTVADAADTGPRSGIVLLNQEKLENFSSVRKRHALIHEIAHILDRSSARLKFIYIDKVVNELISQESGIIRPAVPTGNETLNSSRREAIKYYSVFKKGLEYNEKIFPSSINSEEYSRILAEGEVFAEILALDLSEFPESHLFFNSMQFLNTKVDEAGHLLDMEKPIALSMWKKRKKELGLENTKSILIYYHNNAQALRAFSREWVENREENIQKALSFIQ